MEKFDVLRIRRKLEMPLRNLYFSIPDYYRYGKGYRENYDFLQKSQWWSNTEHQEYQMIQLQKLLIHCYDTVPYYRRIFDERSLRPKDIQSFSDIKLIPYLTKDIIQENFEDLISTKYKRSKLSIVKTGGSTGIPLIFYRDRKFDIENEWAFVSNMWNRVGYDPKSVNKKAIIMGVKPIKGFYEYKNRDLILSSYHINQKNAIEYIEKLEKFNPDFIHTYPSSISILSSYLKDNNIEVKLQGLKAIFCVSENLHEEQRKVIEETFGCRVYSFYGHSEHCCIAGECENSNFYHIASEYGFTEIINESGTDVCNEGELGEIIATGFHNYAMPFIRYRTNDLAINTNQQCSCGRNYRLIKKVEGRSQEMVLTKAGSKVMLTGSYKILHQLNNKIEIGQFYQNTPGVLILNIVPKPEYQKEDSKYLFKEIKEKFGDEMVLRIELVKNIKRTGAGKHKFLIQELEV